GEGLVPRRKLLRDFAFAIDHERRAVEHELVLAADAIDIDHRQARLPHPRGDDLAAQRLLPRVIGRSVGNDDDLGARLARAPRGTGKPDVLADDDAHAHTGDVDQTRLASRLEVALLVENGVVGQLAFAVHGRDLAVAQDRGRVVRLALRRLW